MIMSDGHCKMDLLPDDVLADILRRLAPCGLAASRCVRRSWCAIIDGRQLLRSDLLPLRLDGFFCLGDYTLAPPPYFFSRNRSSTRRISGRFDFLLGTTTPCLLDLQIAHHCNGLLLLELDSGRVVVNPATRQWVRLPPCPSPRPSVSVVGARAMMEEEDCYRDCCLLYDPKVSPHYEVVLIHLLPRGVLLGGGPNSSEAESSEPWPPSPYTTHVFSSRSWRWEQRSFVRQGEAAGTIADKLPGSRLFERHAVYLRGKLYLHCENHSVMRITMSDDKYRVLKCPTVSESEMADAGVLSLAKSEKGVYCGVVLWNDGWPFFRAWFLDELCEEMEWVLKSNISLQAVAQNFPFTNHNINNSSWAVTTSDDEHVEERAGALQEEFEWDSDGGTVLETKDNAGTCHHKETFFLGFHPYKEIAFFWVSYSRVVSYHLNTSNVQCLGILNAQSITKSFPYTPCWMGELCEKNTVASF